MIKHTNVLKQIGIINIQEQKYAYLKLIITA